MSATMEFKGKLVVITGPTASGKTSVAIKIAEKTEAQIISADSRQFFKEIPIGTAAPENTELQLVKHHMIGNLSIKDDYNVSKYEVDVLNLLNSELIENKIVVMVGGSGLYIDAVCKGIDVLPDFDPVIREKVKSLFEANGIESLRIKLKELDPIYYSQVDLNNPMRLMRAIEVCIQTGELYSQLRKNTVANRSFEVIKIGLQVPRDELIEIINKRVDIMIEKGWIKEAKSMYKYSSLNSLNTVGYKELFDYFDGKYTLSEAIEKIKTNTRRYAKRQMTWFRRDEEIHWFNPNDIDGMIELIEG